MLDILNSSGHSRLSLYCGQGSQGRQGSQKRKGIIGQEANEANDTKEANDANTGNVHTFLGDRRMRTYVIMRSAAGADCPHRGRQS